MSGKTAKCACSDCEAQRATRISGAGLLQVGVATTAHDRLIGRLQRRNSRGKARRRAGGRRG